MFFTILSWAIVALFLMAGFMKIMTPYPDFKKKMPWAEDLSAGQVKTVGVLELLGAAGLVLPVWLDIATWLMPLAALGLTMTAWSATVLHVKRKETGSAIFSFSVGCLTALLVYMNVSLLGL